MGIFCVVNKKKWFDLKNQIIETYHKIGFEKILTIETETYNIHYSGKVLVKNYNNLYNSDNYTLLCFGTLSYKHKIESDAANGILLDLEKYNFIEQDKLSGCYSLIILHKNELNILIDSNKLYRVYHNTQNDIFSSSFIVLSDLLRRLSLNTLKISEILLTGLSIGNETIFNDILTLEKNLISTKGILRYNYNIKSIANNLEEEAYLQLESLRNYLDKFSAFNSKKIDVGISGGYDSRLLLALLMQHFPEISLHSNWKKVLDQDLIIAKQIAKKTQKTLVTLSPQEIFPNIKHDKIMEKSLFHYDGQIRVNHGWNRYYRTKEYRKSILNSATIGFSGHNGEQYRNHLNLSKNILITPSFFIRRFLFTTGISNYLKNELELIEYIKNNIGWIDNSSNKLNYLDIRKFYINTWSTYGPAIRISIENKLTYFIAPFMDRDVILKSKNIPFDLLDKGKLQSRMICILSNDLASINSNYGHNFIRIKFYDRLKYDFRTLIRFDRINLIKNQLFHRDRKRIEINSLNILNDFKIDVFSDKIFTSNLRDEHFWDRLLGIAFILKKYQYKIQN